MQAMQRKQRELAKDTTGHVVTCIPTTRVHRNTSRSAQGHRGGCHDPHSYDAQSNGSSPAKTQPPNKLQMARNRLLAQERFSPGSNAIKIQSRSQLVWNGLEGRTRNRSINWSRQIHHSGTPQGAHRKGRRWASPSQHCFWKKCPFPHIRGGPQSKGMTET